MQARKYGPIRRLNGENMNQENKSRKKKIAIAVIIAVVALLAVIGAGTAALIHHISTPEFRYDIALKLGDEYFKNMNNGSALEQYEMAMELMPENLQPYKSIVMVYGNEHDVGEMMDIYDLAEVNLGRRDFKDFQEYFFTRMGHIIEYSITHEEYGDAVKYVEMVAEVDEDVADDFREKYLSDIPWDTVVEEADPATSEDSESVEDPETEEPKEPLREGYEVGEMIPDFEFYDSEGEVHTISEFRGKAVYINFFTTWCTYCFYELPDMESVYEDTADDAAFIMIDLDEGPELGLQYAEDYDVTIPIYYVDGWEIEGMELEAVPLSIVIDSEGVVCGNCLGQASYDWMNDTVNDAINSAK